MSRSILTLPQLLNPEPRQRPLPLPLPSPSYTTASSAPTTPMTPWTPTTSTSSTFPTTPATPMTPMTPKTPTVPTAFHLFPKLPLEIRLRIYTFSLPGPRLIPLVYIPPSISHVSSQPTPQQYQQHQQFHHSNILPPPTIPKITQSRILTPSNSSSSSSSSLPSLLHTNHESRTFIQTIYLPRLPLCGLSPSTDRTQTPYRPTHDILYFPSLPLSPQFSFSNSNSLHNSYLGSNTLNASFTNFSTIHTLATPISLTFVQRLAISEDVFIEMEKSRWGRQRQRAMMDLGGLVYGGCEEMVVGGDEIGIGKGIGGARASGGVIGGMRGRIGKGGIDAITLSNLSEFWDVVRRKFWGVEEVWIVGEGMERKVLEGDMDDCEEGSWRRAFDEKGCERRRGDGYGDRNGMTRQRRMSFKAKIEGAVRRLEEATGWIAPKWRYLGCEAEEDDFLRSGFETAQSRDCLGGDELVHKPQHFPEVNTVAEKDGSWPRITARKFVSE